MSTKNTKRLFKASRSRVEPRQTPEFLKYFRTPPSRLGIIPQRQPTLPPKARLIVQVAQNPRKKDLKAEGFDTHLNEDVAQH